MTERFFFIICLFAVIILTVGADVGSIADITKRMEYLESKMELMENKHNLELEKSEEKTKLREAYLLVKIEQLEARLNTLENKNSALVKTNDLLRGKLSKNLLPERNRTNVASRIAAPDVARQTVNDVHKETPRTMKSKNVNTTDGRTINPRQSMPGQFNVAFSVYLDHDVDAMGRGQKLVFNKLLLNDGGGYSKYTGVFTVPTAGVYFFTYATGERDINQLWTGLLVNSGDKVNGVVQTDNRAEDAQGGNSAVLKLSDGDVVYIQVFTADHVDSSNTYRLSSFSGFLLYPL